MAKSIKVRIKKNGWIPFINKMGPIQYPITVSMDVYEALVKLGFVVIPTETPKISEVKAPLAPAKEVKDDPKVEKKVELEVKKVEPVEEKKEEVAEITPVAEEAPATNEAELEEDEVLVDDPNLSAEAFYTQEFLTSKAVCKKILNARQVQYNDDSSLNFLKKKVDETNPEVDFVM